MKEEKGKSQTRQQILNAAELEFLEKGFYGATTANIAQRAGVNHAMLHYYFQTKENIFDLIIGQKIGMLQADIKTSLMDAGICFMDKIIKVMLAQFDFFMSHREIVTFLVRDILPHEERMKSLISKFVDSGMLGMLDMQLKKEVESGRIKQITLVELVIDLLSLNFFSFLALPVLRVSPYTNFTEEEFLMARKQENILMLKRRLGI